LVCNHAECLGVFCSLGKLNFICLLVLGGGEELPVKKPATDGEFHFKLIFNVKSVVTVEFEGI